MYFNLNNFVLVLSREIDKKHDYKQLLINLYKDSNKYPNILQKIANLQVKKGTKAFIKRMATFIYKMNNGLINLSWDDTYTCQCCNVSYTSHMVLCPKLYHNVSSHVIGHIDWFDEQQLFVCYHCIQGSKIVIEHNTMNSMKMCLVWFDQNLDVWRYGKTCSTWGMKNVCIQLCDADMFESQTIRYINLSDLMEIQYFWVVEELPTYKLIPQPQYVVDTMNEHLLGWLTKKHWFGSTGTKHMNTDCDVPVIMQGKRIPIKFWQVRNSKDVWKLLYDRHIVD